MKTHWLFALSLLLVSCGKETTTMPEATNLSDVGQVGNWKVTLPKLLAQQDAQNDYRTIRFALTDPNHGSRPETRNAYDIVEMANQGTLLVSQTDRDARTGFSTWQPVHQQMQTLLNKKRNTAQASQYKQLAAYQLLFRTNLLTNPEHPSLVVDYATMLFNESECAPMLYFALRNTRDHWAAMQVTAKLPSRLKLCKSSVDVMKKSVQPIREEGIREMKRGQAGQQLVYEQMADDVEKQIFTEEFYIRKMEAWLAQ